MADAQIANVRLTFHSRGIIDNNCWYSLSWVKLHGVRFELSSIVVLDISESSGLPQFGEIKNIYLLDNDEVTFECVSLESIDFNEHYYAYQVQRTNNYLLHNYNTIVSPVPATMTIMSNLQVYVTVRWTLE